MKSKHFSKHIHDNDKHLINDPFSIDIKKNANTFRLRKSFNLKFRI